MRVLCNRCKNIFNTEDYSSCPYCGQTGRLPTEADYIRSKPMERERKIQNTNNGNVESLKNTQNIRRKREVKLENSVDKYTRKENVSKRSKPKTEIEYTDDSDADVSGGLLEGTVKVLVFVAVALVVFFGGVAGGYAFLSSYTSGNKNVAENIRPIDSFYSGVQEGFQGYPVIATAFLPFVTDNGTDTMKITYYDNFNTVYAALRSISGDNISIDYDVTSETKLSSEKLQEIKADLEQKMTTNINLSTGYNVVTKAVVSAGDDLTKVKVEFTTICLNNTWYIYDLNLVEE